MWFFGLRESKLNRFSSTKELVKHSNLRLHQPLPQAADESVREDPFGSGPQGAAHGQFTANAAASELLSVGLVEADRPELFIR